MMAIELLAAADDTRPAAVSPVARGYPQITKCIAPRGDAPRRYSRQRATHEGIGGNAKENSDYPAITAECMAAVTRKPSERTKGSVIIWLR